jgi:DGQHR domain-containing protein
MSPAPDKHGYQRPPTKARFPQIATYFQKKDNANLITPLIVSVRLTDLNRIDRFLALVKEGNLDGIKAEFGDRIASTVDGQHRRGGIIYGWEQDSTFTPTIPLFMYFGLSFAEEADLFNTVNVEQKKLPKALIETNRGDIIQAGEVSYEQKLRRIAFSLCRDIDSVWGPINGVEQVNMTGVRDPNKAVTYEGLRRSTSNMFPPTLLSRLEHIDPGLPLTYAKRYWKAVSEACEGAWNGVPAVRQVIDETTGDEHDEKILYRIKDLVGVASLAKLGKEINNSHLDAKGDPKKLEELAGKLASVDWEKSSDNPWMRSQAGFAGQKDLYEVLYNWVYMDQAPGEQNQDVDAKVA